MRLPFITLPTRLAAVGLLLLLSAGVRASQLVVSWDDNSTGETGFRVERSIDGNVFTPIATVPADTTTYADASVVAGTAYWYRICAYTDTACSDYSNVATGMVALPPAPIAPTIVPGRLARVSAQAVAAPWGATSLRLDFGIAGGSKTVLARAIGPSLAAYTTASVFPDPVLQLIDGAGTLIASNDNWSGGATLADAFVKVGAFPLAALSKDAAILTSLPTTSYSAVISGKAGGMALAELYDADPSASSAQFSNICVRGSVGKGTAALTVGFVISGDTPVRLLVRAIGPSLSGLQGLLANPQLDIYSGATLVQHNDNWDGGSALAALFRQVGASTLATKSKDAAIDVTLPPGTYSAVVSGVSGGTGLARLEFYPIP